MTDDPKPKAGRTERGTFAKGASGNPLGRPRRPDLFRVASEYAAREGIDLERALFLTVQKMLELAQDGDVGAAKLVFDRLCDQDPLSVELTTRGIDRVEAVKAILEQAAKRGAAEQAE
jgi:hypothetical protein